MVIGKIGNGDGLNKTHGNIRKHYPLHDTTDHGYSTMEKQIRFYTIQEWREKHKNDLNEPIIMSFKDSSGERWTKTAIDHKIREAKKEFTLENDWNGMNYCWACHRTEGKRLTVSHIISVNKCQNDGRCNEAWNKDNFQLECMECHADTERGTIDHHQNREYKKSFIRDYNESNSLNCN